MLDASAQHAGRTGSRDPHRRPVDDGSARPTRRRDARAGQPHRSRGRPSGRQLLARHAPAARDRHRADRRPRRARPRRAGQRPRPCRHPLDAGPPPRLRGRGRDGPAVLAPAARGRDRRRRHRDDRRRPDRLPGLQGGPPARRGQHRPRRRPAGAARSPARLRGWTPRSPTTAPSPPTPTPARVGQVALRAGVAVSELRPADSGLEDMFLQLTADTQRETARTERRKAA